MTGATTADLAEAPAAATDDAPPGSGRHAAPAGDLAPLADAAERGSLTVADRVVERTAGWAITQLEGASAAPRRILGVRVGDARPEDQASVSARVDGRTATLDATIAVAWPSSVADVTRRLRSHLREELRRVADVEVAQIDLDVVSFAGVADKPRRVQ